MVYEGIVYHSREGKAVEGYNCNSLKQGWAILQSKTVPSHLLLLARLHLLL